MDIRIEPAQSDQFNALYSVMALAGEHMHRVLNLSHWHPFVTSEYFTERFATDGRDMFAVYADDLIIGTFNLGTQPEPYYLEDMSAYWMDASAPAMYFSAFALLPSHQQQGIGSQCMAFVDDHIRNTTAYRYVRFDGVATHPKLLTFYSRLGYEKRGELPVRTTSVMCFEKYLKL